MRPLPAGIPQAERDFYLELQTLIDTAGFTVRGLEKMTSSAKSPSSESCFYSKSQWARWINGLSRPPRKAIRTLAAKLAGEGLNAGHLLYLWDKAFAAAPENSLAGRTLVPPRQLPAGTAYFTGRAAELDVLNGLADEAARAAGAMVIAAISGTAGVGKTNLEANTRNRYKTSDAQRISVPGSYLSSRSGWRISPDAPRRVQGSEAAELMTLVWKPSFGRSRIHVSQAQARKPHNDVIWTAERHSHARFPTRSRLPRCREAARCRPACGP